MLSLYRLFLVYLFFNLGISNVAVEATIPSRGSSPQSPPDAQQNIPSPEQDKLLEKAYVWAWPMVYLSNVRKSLQWINRPGVSGGAPVAPINRLSMLTEPASPHFNSVACPNRDVIYGFAMLDLSETPIVIQVPDANDRFWMYQVGDHRTDSFAELGSIYQTKPGFYMLIGPEWNDSIPDGIEKVFRSSTNLAYFLPRFFVGNEPSDALLDTLSQVVIYPADQFDGTLKQRDWTKRKWYPSLGGNERTDRKLANPDTFLVDLARVIKDVPPLPGEESFYNDVAKLLKQAQADSQFAKRLEEKISILDRQRIEPLFNFRHVGSPLPTLWTTVANGAQFGTDFETRTAVAKSNIFINRPAEAKYFYLEQDSTGELFQGDRSYSITFLPDELPPNDAYWSLTIYDANHRLVSHPTQPSSILGSSSKLIWQKDGSVTFRVQRNAPNEASDANWLPTPEGQFVLYLRVYSPSDDVIDGTWIPPFAVASDLPAANKRLVLWVSDSSHND